MKHTRHTAVRKILRTTLLSATCAFSAFVLGMQTSGNVHPVGRSEAAAGKNDVALLDVTPGRTPLRGDVNENGILDLGDAVLIGEISEGLEDADPRIIALADRYGDGRVTTASDLLPLLRLLTTY